MKSQKTVTVDDVEYTISAIPIDHSPYLKLVNSLLTAVPESKEQADKNQKALAHSVDKILAATVDKKVPTEHQNFIYNLVINYHNITVEEAEKQAELFRDQPNTPD